MCSAIPLAHGAHGLHFVVAEVHLSRGTAVSSATCTCPPETPGGAADGGGAGRELAPETERSKRAEQAVGAPAGCDSPLRYPAC